MAGGHGKGRDCLDRRGGVLPVAWAEKGRGVGQQAVHSLSVEAGFLLQAAAFVQRIVEGPVCAEEDAL